ncbi:uncharacterized protein LOC142585519 [Dermacentor variabilis]|uniref:uncharacterized protein LOC142585519 n=1 Tax=Dermacentor variabilis TaxID=34621 RepID=UPI003F5B8C85
MWPVLRIAAYSNVLLLRMSAVAEMPALENVLPKGESQLGHWCRTDSNCLADNSGCLAEICACMIGFVLYEDRCIPEPRNRNFSKVYLMSIGCLLSILIFSMSLCFLYWKRKLDDRRNLEMEDSGSVAGIAPPLWSDECSSDKPPSYEVAVNRSCFRFKLEAPTPSSWHALPSSDDQVAITFPPAYGEVTQHEKRHYARIAASRASI